MKKFNYLMIAAMFGLSAIVFTGCSKDEEENTNASDVKLLGTWTFDDTDVEVEIDGQDAESWFLANDFDEDEAASYAFYMQQEMSDEFLPEGATFEFNDDNTFVVGIPGNVFASGTWEFNDDKTEIMLKEIGEQANNGRISTDGNEIKVKEEGEDEDEIITFGVASMTNTMMVLTNIIEEDDDFNDDDTDETLTITSKYEFVK